MTRQSVREYLARQRGRYVAAARAELERLLDEVAAVTGYHRKAIIRALGAGRPPARGGRRTDTSILTTRPVLWDRSLTSRFGGGRIATCPSVQAFQG